MKLVTTLAVAGMAGLLATGGVAHAQGSAGFATKAVATESGAATPELDDRQLRRRMASADRALEEGSLIHARRLYEGIVKDLETANRLPTEAQWRLASVKFQAGDRMGAATTLDELATTAAEHGAVEVEALALLEAARVYEMTGRIGESVDRLERGVSLLSSPAISETVRVSLLRKVRE